MGVFALSRSEDEGRVFFTLFNDGIAGKKNIESNGLGLKYVRARLEEAYGRNWQLDSQSVDGGWQVTIAIRKKSGGLSGEPGSAHPVAIAGSGSTA